MLAVQVIAKSEHRSGRCLPWSPETSFVDVHTIPGDHVHMTDEPHVQALVEVVKRCLASSSCRTA